MAHCHAMSSMKSDIESRMCNFFLMHIQHRFFFFFWFVFPFNRCSKKLQRVGKKEGLRLTTVDPVIFLFFTSGSVNPKPFFISSKVAAGIILLH